MQNISNSPAGQVARKTFRSVQHAIDAKGNHINVLYPTNETYIRKEISKNLEPILDEFSAKIPVELKDYIKPRTDMWTPIKNAEQPLSKGRYKSIETKVSENEVSKTVYPNGGKSVREKASSDLIGKIREFSATIPESIKSFVDVTFFKWNKM